jgi:hypothetical protein
MINFGAGNMFGTPKTTASGGAVSNPTVAQFGVLQDVSIDISFEEKMLHGAKTFPVAFGRGKGKVSGKASFAEVYGRVYGDLFFGIAPSSSIKAVAADVAGTVPAVSAYTVTPTVPSSGTWVQDLGVKNATTGVPLTRVASGPTAGQYSVSAGVYTFAAADASAAVLISFEYSATSTVAKVITLSNQLMGLAPEFQLHWVQPFNGKMRTVVFTRCIASKLTLPVKNDDFTIEDFEFTAIADASDSLGYIALSE